MATCSDSDVLALLGQESANDNVWAARDAVRAGLPFSAFERIQQATGLHQTELSKALAIPVRTLTNRRQAGEAFHLDESDRLYRLAYTTTLAAHVLGSQEKARDWLREPNTALGGEVPLDLLDTDDGHRRVREILLRIQYGYFS